MRASRLVSMLLLLQARGRMTAQELASELEVSVRTVYRDVEALSASGVPVYADRGAAGGYRLLAGYRTRLTGLTGDEAESLFLAGLPDAAAELGLGAVLAGAQRKLLAALPEPSRDRAERLRERFHLDPLTWFREEEPVPYLAELADAVWNQRPVEVRYRRWGARGAEVNRVLHPLGVVVKAGAWYLVARAGGQDRTYRVSRVLRLRTLDGRFERPAGFDLAAFWRDCSERVEAGMYRGEATVRLSPRALDLLPYVLGAAVTRAAAATAGPPDAAGWVEAVIPVESIRHAVGDLLRLGTEVEVLAPGELRDGVAAAVRVLAARYAAAPATSRVTGAGVGA